MDGSAPRRSKIGLLRLEALELGSSSIACKATTTPTRGQASLQTSCDLHMPLRKERLMLTYTYAFATRAKAELMLLKGDQKGVTALEYGLLAGLIAVVIIAGVTLVGTNLNTMFTDISAKLVLPT